MSALSQKFWMLLALLACVSFSLGVELKVMYEWKYFDYDWISTNHKQNSIDNGEYDHTKIIPMDFQIISGGRLLITTPRFDNNPASLSMVSEKIGAGGPLLEPYPNWDWHRAGNCSGITSVHRLFLDDCKRLWLVDSGKIGNEQICPAKLLAFNSETDELLISVVIPSNVSHSSKDPNKGRLEVQIVETKGEYCEKTWVYMGDPEGYGLVIWDGLHIWRLENDDVYAPDPTATTYDAGGKNVTLDIGVASFALTPSNFIEQPYLLFKPYSSFNDFAVSLEDLHNSKWGKSVTYYQGNITLTSQELARVFTKSGIILGGLAGQPVVACWNLENPLASEYIGTPLEDEALQFVNAAKTAESDKTDLYLLSNNLPNYVLGSMDSDEVNFRILSVDVSSLVSGTVCEPTSSPTISTIEDKFFFEYEKI